MVPDKVNEPEEILDLVDKNDKVIGEVRKGVANEDPGLIHREVAVIVFDVKGRVLLQRRSLGKKVHPGKWSTSCAGHVPKGMEPVEAALKELKEELGLSLELRFIEKVRASYPWETHFGYWYMGKFTGGNIDFLEDEVEEVKFVNRAEFNIRVKRGEITENSAKMIRRFFEGEFGK